MLLHQEMNNIVFCIFLKVPYHYVIDFARVHESNIENPLPTARLNLHSTKDKGICISLIVTF